MPRNCSPLPCRLLLLLALGPLAGCATLGALTTTAQPTRAPGGGGVDRDAAAALLMTSMIQTLQRLAQGSPAEQAEIVATARQGYERSPGGGAQLRYALALATPGHAGRNVAQARQLLRELSAQPEELQPAERALTLLELAQLDREAGLQTENERLQSDAQRGERLATLTKKLQLEMDDNAKLRRQLEDAQTKLDAIANIERNLSERKNTTQGRKQ